MPEIVASFAVANPCSLFHVVRGDALAIESDLAVVGRAHQVRQRLAQSGARFGPVAEATARHLPERAYPRVLEAALSAGPWRHVLAIDYRPGYRTKAAVPSLQDAGGNVV